MQLAEADPADTRGASLAFMWEVIRPFRLRALALMVLVLADTALATLGVGIILPVFQTLLDPEHSNALLENVLPFLADLTPDARLLTLAMGTILLFLAKAAVSFCTVYATHRFLLGMRFYWVSHIGENYLFGPHLRLAGRKQGELLNDWFNETWAAARFFQSALTYFSSGALALAMIVLGLLVNWQAMLALLVGGTLVFMFARKQMYSGAARLSRVKVQTNQAVTAAMAEDLANARDLKLMQAEAMRLGQLAELCSRLMAVLLRGAVTAEIPRIAGEFLAVLALMAFVVVGVSLMELRPHDILPVMAFFFVAFYRLMSAASMVMSARVKSLNELHSVRLVHRLVQSSHDREDQKAGGSGIRTIETDICFQGLSYEYAEGKSALAGIDAIIPKGRNTLLVGPSGSGKSTLLDALMRLIEPDIGCIKANHRDAREFDLSQWRSCFGYVSQEAVLFNGSVRMNLLLAKPGASEADIEEACRVAGADEFIRALPQGYETTVGDRGYSLSGGQRKRIAIARALMRKPSVLILDEATTAFEQSLEQEILSRVRAAMPNLAVVHVTHRPHAVDGVDWVIALESGKVVATGPWTDIGLRVLPDLSNGNPDTAILAK